MVIFRVHGFRGSEGETSILVECSSEAVARNAAVREGFTNTTKVELIEGEAEGDVVSVPRFTAGSRSEDLSKFQRQPVWTIAKGVFFGLLMWTAFTMALYVVLQVIDAMV